MASFPASDTNLHFLPFMALHNSAEMATTVQGLQKDEAALYDRQIRVWGLDAQIRFVCVVTTSALHELSHALASHTAGCGVPVF